MGALTGAPTGGTGRSRRVSTWSGTAHAHPAAFHAPADESELAAVVAAANGSGERIRVIGAGHSFTPVALGTGTMISLDALSGIVAVDAATRRVRFRAGTRLRDIPALLAPHGLALANQGDVDPQSLAGAISTGTHGTGLGFTGFAGMVTGLTLLTADGARRELSRAADPDVFDLARLSLGVLGVITEIELACVPRFDVVAREQSEPFDDLLATFVARSAQCDHLKFYWFPHTDRALVKTNVRVAPGQAPPAGMSAARPRRRLAQLLNEEVLDNGALRAICEIGHRAPALVPFFNRAAAEAASNRLSRAPAHEAFVSPRRVRFTEMEYAVPLAAGPEVLARIRDLIEERRWRISFPLEVRTTAADDVPLSTATGRESMYIACHRFFRDDSAEYFRRIEQICREFDGHPHWGKVHTLTAAELGAVYPRFEDFRTLRARLDPHAVFGSAYTDSLFAPER